jgi:hypothetical protein
MVEMFYPVVHTDCYDFSKDPDTGKMRRHSFCKIAILPDFIANNPAACSLLDLCP